MPNFDSTKLGTSTKIEWQEVSEAGDNTIAVKFQNNTTKYYKYTYTQPSDYTTETPTAEHQEVNSGDTIDITNKTFVGNFVSIPLSNLSKQAYGGAIYNNGNITQLTADFIENYTYIHSQQSKISNYGGAIYNSSDPSSGNKASIGSIIGDFIGNYVSSLYNSSNASVTSENFGGAIYNASASIGDITGDFVGNYVSAYSNAHVTKTEYASASSGGAIYNGAKSAIDNITGNFIGNYTFGEGAYAVPFGGAIYNTNNATIGNITGDFIGNYAQASTYKAFGGAIYNGANAAIDNIISDFIGNYVSSGKYGYGGAIYNTDSATIDSIIGNFIGNYILAQTSGYGGVIYNTGNATINNITGDFIDNYVQSHESFGGVIYNTGNATIGNITGDFIGNHASVTDAGYAIHAYGGAIYNGVKLANVKGNFINNYATGSKASGGAIYNGVLYTSSSGDSCYDSGTFGDVTGDFINNYAISSGSNPASGGAIFNGTILGNVTGDFKNNYVTGSEAFGGAIYNSGTLGKENGGIINSNFYDNYAKGIVSANGGAIWTNKDLSIIADNGSSTFKGNYVQLRDNNKDYQAIYAVDSTLNLVAQNNGTIYMYDDIDGTNYNLALNGDESGKINLLGYVKNASTVTLDSTHLTFAEDTFNSNGLTFDAKTGFIDLNDDISKIHNIDKLQSNENVKWNIDVDFAKKEADTFITNNESKGTVTLDSLNYISEIPTVPEYPQMFDANYKIQILKTQNDSLKLALTDALAAELSANKYYIRDEHEDKYDPIIADIKWDHKFDIYDIQTDIYGRFGLVTTDTTNDSIGIVESPSESEVLPDKLKASQGDTLALWNTNPNAESKSFTFDSANDIYKLGEYNQEVIGAGETKGSVLNINGVKAADGSRSTLDLNLRNGFEVNDATTLNISDLNLIRANGSAIKVSNSDAVVNLLNTNLTGNKSLEAGSAIWSMGAVNITADDAKVEIIRNYTDETTDSNQAIYIANTAKTLKLNVINNGTLTVDDIINGKNGYNVNITGDETGRVNLFDYIQNANVNIEKVTANFADRVIREQEFETFTSDANAKYEIDIDFANQKADTFKTNKASNGIITLAGLNKVSEIPTVPEYPQMFDANYKIQILKTQNDSLKLALTDALAAELSANKYYIRDEHKDKYDEILANTQWDKKYDIYDIQTDIYGRLGLVTTDTENDSIGIIESPSDTEVRPDKFKASQGDTLALWNKEEIKAADGSLVEKNFNFDSAENKYIVGQYNPETLTLGETKGSVLNINGVKAADGSRSTIDMNLRNGFDLVDASVLNINNVNITKANGSAIKVSNSDAVVNLLNTNLTGNKSLEAGSAIWSMGAVNITADDAKVEISDNYTAESVSSNAAIYMANANKALTLRALNNGSLTLNDMISGVDRYTVNITGDSTGTVNLNDEINKANVNVDSVRVNLSQGVIQDHVFETLKSNANANYVLDIDFANNTTDRIITNEASNGIITLAGLQIANELVNPDKDYKIQILKTQDNSLQLALSDNLKNSLTNEYFLYSYLLDEPDEVLANTNWKNLYDDYNRQMDVFGKLTIVTSETTNDSLGIVESRRDRHKDKTRTNSQGDTLALWNKEEIKNSDGSYVVKNFKFDTPKDEYLVAGRNPEVLSLGTVAGNELHILGKLDKESGNRSTINLNQRDGFTIDSAAEFDVENVTLKNGNGTVFKVTDENATLNFVNTNLIENISTASGSAIHSASTVNFLTDGTTTEISNNHTQGTSEDNEAIYIANKNKALNITTINKGTLTLNDIITGETGYTVNITGDETGTVNLFGDINNANVNIDKTNINTADSNIKNYEFESLDSKGSANYILDIDFTNNSSDKFTVANDSNGVVTISGLNFINNVDKLENPNEDYKIQILDVPESSSIQLALTDSVENNQLKEIYTVGTHIDEVPDEIQATTKWSDKYYNYDQQTDINGKLTLATTKTENDSIGIQLTGDNFVHDKENQRSLGDTLALWNREEIKNADDSYVVKNFDFESAGDIYTVAKNNPEVLGLGETNGKQINIHGVLAADATRSIIDLNNRQGFEINPQTPPVAPVSKLAAKSRVLTARTVDSVAFNVENVSFEYGNGSVFKVKDENATLNFVNTNFLNNTSSESGSAIYSVGDVNFETNGTITEISNNHTQGTSENNEAIYIANANKALNINTINNGALTLNDIITGEKGYTVNITGDETGTINLFGDIKNANVNIEKTNINTADNIIKNYEFESLISDKKSNYALDINFADKSSDKITTANDSDGRVTISSLNFITEAAVNPDEDYNEYKIQILNTPTDKLQLALSQEMQEQLNTEYKIGVRTEETSDKVVPNVKWDDEFNIYVQKGDVYGKFDLATTSTKNDSIGIIKTRDGELGKKEFVASAGDTLALWNTLDTNEEKNFNFNSATNEYIVAETDPDLLSLGETNGNVLNINGVIDENIRSTIDLTANAGFTVAKKVELNINNVELTNSDGTVINVTDENAVINLKNVNLTENKSNTNGSAINSKSDVNITADNAKSEISNNSTIDSDESDAIYIANKNKTLTLKSINEGELTLNDSVNGEKGYTVDITGDSTGVLNLFNNLNNANVLMGNTTVNTANDTVNVYNIESLKLTADTKLVLDVDLKNKTMDRFTAASYGDNGSYILNVIGMNLLQTGAPEEKSISIYFAENGLKDNVRTSVSQVAYSPIYKYNVKYDNREDGGYFLFNRARSSNPSSEFNPSILTAPIANVASQAAVNETFQHVFEHADWFTKLPSMQRKARINANKYAASTDFNQNLLPFDYQVTNQAGWYKPYVTFESMGLRNGPKVDAKTYGSLAGFDTDFFHHKNGWNSVGTGYAGYNGSTLDYQGIDTNMNGGLLGYTHTMYKNNFWTALTLATGASVGDSQTMYGKETYTSIYSGLASKTGYNFEFKDGKYILQPIMLMGYTFVKTFDYTNPTGIRIKPNATNSIQLNPSVRFIANTKKGWQPYAHVGVVWNVMNENKVMANNVALPQIGMKPYVEYGVGIQRIWKDKFTAYGQTTIRNGGRNGISLTGGIRWTLGKDANAKLKTSKTSKKVSEVNKKQEPTIIYRKVVSQLTPEQRLALKNNKY